MTFLKSLSLATALVAASSTWAAAEVKIALDTPPNLDTSGSYVWAHTFGQYLTDHGMEVREIPRGAIGGEAEKLDQLSTGLLEVSLSDVKSVGKIDPFIYGVRLPYIFDGVAHMDRVFKEENLYDRINAQTAVADVKLMALVPLGPPSGIANTQHAVKTPADMEDLRMRALDDAQIALYKAWGATGTIVPWKEVPAALQTGVVDGYINPSLVPLMFGQTDIIKYFSDARVINGLRAAVISLGWYEGLSDAERQIVDEAVAAADTANRAWLDTVSETSLEALSEAGVEVTRLSDAERDKFRQLSTFAYSAGVLSEDQIDAWINLSKAHR